MELQEQKPRCFLRRLHVSITSSGATGFLAGERYPSKNMGTNKLKSYLSCTISLLYKSRVNEQNLLIVCKFYRVYVDERARSKRSLSAGVDEGSIGFVGKPSNVSTAV